MKLDFSLRVYEYHIRIDTALTCSEFHTAGAWLSSPRSLPPTADHPCVPPALEPRGTCAAPHDHYYLRAVLCVEDYIRDVHEVRIHDQGHDASREV